ncbi:MAG: SusC/RagA family TonB-linked outer membrane protein, partial [Odoribacteraceae bacterium]|nr:SusC/RagA family TonB-linked outer membrane protein [Odoribacteraceae bacterium]
MKLLSIFMFAFVVCVSANGYAQKQVVSLDLRQSDVGALFREIRKQTGLRFVYNEQHARSLPRFDVRKKNARVDEVLDEVFGESPLQWFFEEDVIFVTPRQQVRPQAATAATERVSGSVRDERGNPLPGVTIRISGSQMGYITNAEGIFQFNIPLVRDTLTLIFSFVGMKTQPVLLKKLKEGETRKALHVTMREEQVALEDVVVTGYANIRKSSFTGTATRITRDELQKVTTGNVLQALQVFDPSLRTVRNNEMGSDPNTLPEFNIRGAAGVGITDLDRVQSNVSQFALKNNPNLPVFILDGYEVTTEKIYDMDPNRIESVTILKDAAATAMYGSRAANGVIVIETVAPKPGELRVTYNLTGTFTAPDLSSYNLMNAREKIEAEVAAGLLDERSSFYQYFSEYRAKMNNIERGIDTYWLSQPLRTQVNHRHSLYLEGGAESVRMGLGLNYDAEAGVMKGSYRDRVGAELRADYRVRGIQVTDNVSFTRMRSQASPYGEFSTYVKLSPYFPIYNPDTGEVEEINRVGVIAFTNPLYNAVHARNFKRSGYLQFSNNFSINAFFLDYFQLKFQFAATYTENDSEQFFDPNDTSKFNSWNYTPATRGELDLDESTSLAWNSNLMLMYNRDIRDHNINLNLGLNANEEEGKSASYAYNGFPSAQFHDPKYANGMLHDPDFDDEHSRLIGVLLLGNYTFRDTYLLDLSLRADGSSKFGNEQRFAPFWSVGAGVNLHHYDLVKKYPFVNSARVKVNYGQTG